MEFGGWRREEKENLRAFYALLPMSSESLDGLFIVRRFNLRPFSQSNSFHVTAKS